MYPGNVIGKVTFSQIAPALRGGRWLIVSRMGADELTGKNKSPLSSEYTPVVYDTLGAGEGDQILYVEGAEATAPFDQPTPLDAISVSILDTIEYTPPA